MSLLVGTDGASWHAWLQESARGKDLVLLDPGDAHYGPAARLHLIRDGKSVHSCFFGSLDPQRAPHVLIAACAELAAKSQADCNVQLYPYRASPLMRQLTLAIAYLLRPDRILLAEGTTIDTDGWPIGPESIALPKGLPAMIVQAQRKAQWLKLIERGQSHEIRLAETSIQGTRLGSGAPLSASQRTRAGLDRALYAEVCGPSLFAVSNEDPEEVEVARALDATHTARAHFVHPKDYDNLLCAFMRPNGDVFGYGRIDTIDFESGVAHVQADAIPPVPVPVLQIGSLRVDRNGKELGETKPWSL